MAMCTNIGPQGRMCDFFRWYPGSSSSSSQSLSPSITPPPPTPPPLLATPSHPPLLFSQPVMKRTCPAVGCAQTHLADDCTHGRCRKHCIEVGGCISKKHKVSATPQLLAPSPSGPSSILMAATLDVPSAPGSSGSTPFRLSIPNVIDSHPDPIHASQIRPIHTYQLNQEYEILEAQRQESATRLVNTKRVKESVTVHAWNVEDQSPVVRAFQEGFTWPYFALTEDVLSGLALSESGQRRSLQKYDEGLVMWVDVDVGHAFEVTVGAHVLLKDAFIPYDNCPGLREHQLALKPNHGAHLRYNLPQERAYVNEVLRASSTAMASPPPWIITPSPTQSPSPLAYFPPAPLVVTTPLAPLSSPQSLDQLYPSVTSGLSPIAPSPTPPVRITHEKRWPADYYVCDIVWCFQDCTTYVRRTGQPNTRVADAFGRHFPGVRYVSSTYSDQKKIWRNAPDKLKDRFFKAGHTNNALWQKFVHQARKRSTSSTILELSD